MMTIQLKRRWPLVLVAALVIGIQIGAPSLAASAAGSSSPSATPLFWSDLSSPNAPTAAADPSLAYDGDTGSILLFSEVTLPGRPASTATWTWDGTTWANMDPATAPPPRRMASLAFDPVKHQMILFGGISPSGALLNDTWAWNGSDWVAMTSAPPPAREGAALSYDSAGDLVLFGGTGEPPAVASSATPTTPVTPTTVPVAGMVDAAGASQAQDSAADAGSTTTTPETPVSGPASPAGGLGALNDTWIWNGTGWSLAAPADSPPARTDAALAYDSLHRDTVLFGGSATISGAPAGEAPLADTWTWDGTTWTPQTPSASPGPRLQASLSFDPDLGLAVLFGGDGTSGPLDDTWLWDGTTWTPAQATTPPPARTAVQAAYDLNGHHVLLFGGTGPDGSTLADTWVLSADAPVTLKPQPLPTTAPTTLASASIPSGASGTVAGTPSGPSAAGPGTTRPGSSAAATSSARTAQPSVRPAPGTSVPLTATAHALHQGDVVTLAGSGFRAGALITVTFHSRPSTVGQVRADQNGRFSITVEVPQGAAAGLHHFEAVGESQAGKMATLITTVEVLELARHSGHRSPLETLSLFTISLLIPLFTWLALSGASKWRRRQGTPA